MRLDERRPMGAGDPDMTIFGRRGPSTRTEERARCDSIDGTKNDGEQKSDERTPAA
jgi:hypothetical protein